MFYFMGVCFWIIQLCLFCCTASFTFCCGLFAFQRSVFKACWGFVTGPLSIGHRRFSFAFVLCVCEE